MMWKQEPTELSWEGKTNSDTVGMAEKGAGPMGVCLVHSSYWCVYLFCVLCGFKLIIRWVLFYTSKYRNYLQDEMWSRGHITPWSLKKFPFGLQITLSQIDWIFLPPHAYCKLLFSSNNWTQQVQVLLSWTHSRVHVQLINWQPVFPIFQNAC